MADTYTWKIVTLDRVIADGGVYTAHWTVTTSRDVTTDGKTKTYQAGTYGSQSFTPDPTDSKFIPYADVTEANAIAWVKEALGSDVVTAKEAALTKDLDLQITPVDATGVPW
jgi:hypothetical protein